MDPIYQIIGNSLAHGGTLQDARAAVERHRLNGPAPYLPLTNQQWGGYVKDYNRRERVRQVLATGNGNYSLSTLCGADCPGGTADLRIPVTIEFVDAFGFRHVMQDTLVVPRTMRIRDIRSQARQLFEARYPPGSGRTYVDTYFDLGVEAV